MISHWVGVSVQRGNAPKLTRLRTSDGMFALRIVCWHGAQGELSYPDRATIENWEYYASLNPCRWVESCPRFPALQDPELSRQDALGGFVDMVPPSRRTAAAERYRRRNR